jgi:hypothetical protein
MSITVRIASNFGNRAVYPVCAKAKLLADMIGTKTFTDRAISQIKALGYDIIVEQASL